MTGLLESQWLNRCFTTAALQGHMEEAASLVSLLVGFNKLGNEMS